MKNIKKKILNTYNQLYKIKDDISDSMNYPEFIIDEFLMFVSIYSHYNFKDYGCPYYDINQVNQTYPENNNIKRFEPKYTIFLQDVYDLLFDWIFDYKVKSTKIRIVKLNIKININYIQFEIINNKTIGELIIIIAEYYNLKTFNLIIKKNNNIILDNKKHIIEYKLDDTSRVTLYFNQFA
jgi:hypothetical protein